jgi:hypothetical protein
LEFQTGELNQVTAVHWSNVEELAKNYDGLYAEFRTMYGVPHVDRVALVGPCSVALAECLRNGEKPKGPVWRFPAVTIEIQPVWEGDHPVLEARYTRFEAVNP